LDHNCGNLGLLQGCEGLKAPLAADQVENLSIDWLAPPGDGDRLFQTQRRDIRYDSLKDDFVSTSGIEDMNLVDRDHLDLQGLFVHAASVILVRSVMVRKNSSSSNR